MATYKDINSSVRIGGSLTLPAGSITLGNKITLDNATGQITATKFSGDGSLLTNLSSAAMTDVLKLDGSRAMTGQLAMTSNRIFFRTSADSNHTIGWTQNDISGATLDGPRIQGYTGVELTATNGSAASTIATFRSAGVVLKAATTVTGNLSAAGYTITGTTINATGNLQENGTNLSAKYLTLTGGTLTGGLVVNVAGTNTTTLTLTNTNGTVYVKNWAGMNYIQSTQDLYITGNNTTNMTNLKLYANATEAVGTMQATAYKVGATTVIETDAKVDWNKIKNAPATYTPSVHTHLWADITDKPSTFVPSVHTHLWADITDKPSTFTPSTHTHLWADITDKPTTFTPSTHIHAITDVTNLQTSLNAKLDATANAVSASKWATARKITLAGDTTGNVTFDGTADVTLTVAVTDDSHDHNWLHATDKRDVKPVDTNKTFFRTYFTSLEGLTGTAGTDYQDLLVLNTYTDNTGGKVNALAFDKSQMTILHYQALQADTTWGTPKTIAYTDSSITGNAATSSKWTTGRTITLSGDLSGSVSIDGSANVTLTAAVLDNSHSHIVGDVTGLQTTLDTKVDKVAGKQLSTEDYTTPEKTKLAGVSTGATKTLSHANNGSISVDGVEQVVYTHPANHPATMITTDTSNRFVADSDITNWNAKATTAVATTMVNGLMSSTDKTKLDGISTGANKTTSSVTNGNVKVDGVETTVYTHPANHLASVITQDANNRFTTDAEKTTWNAKANNTFTITAGSGLTGGGDLTANRTLSVSFGGNGVATTVSRSDHNHDATYLALAGGTVTGSTTINGAVILGSTLDVAGIINAKNFDFRLGTGDQVSRGDSGTSRALVKNTGSTLIINYASDFTGGTIVQSTLESTGRMKAPSYYVGAALVIDTSGKVDWTSLKSIPTTFTPAAHTHVWSDITSGKPTTVSGYGITDAITTAGGQTISGNLTVNGNMSAGSLFQQFDGNPRSNLGNPTVTEMAIFNQQFTNKTWFYDPTKITFEYTNDGTNWIDATPSTNTIKDFVCGMNNTNISIPNACQQFRITIKNDGNYVFLNALYMYWSSSSHSTQVKIQRKSIDDAVTTWTDHTNSATKISAWPGHMYLPFPTIPFSQNVAQNGYIRIIFTPTWSSDPTYGTYPISLNGMEVWGGYPSGRRDIFAWDRDKNVSFPTDVKAATLTATTSLTAPAITVGSNAVWHAGNLTPSNYLPLAGGTMTSGLLFTSAATGGVTNATPTGLSYGKLQANGNLSILADTDGSQTEYLFLSAGSSAGASANGLAIGYSTLKWKDNNVWHAGTLDKAEFAVAVHVHDDRYYTESEMDTKLSTKSDTGHTHAYSTLTGIPTTFTPSTHTHLWADLTDKPATFAPSAHTHSSLTTTNADVILGSSTWSKANGETNILGSIKAGSTAGDSRLMIFSDAGSTNVYVDGTVYVKDGAQEVWHGANFTPSSKLDTTTPMITLDTTGSTIYPRMVFANNPGTDLVGWVRANSDAGGILPYSNGNSSIGTSTWKFKEVHGVTLYENGTALSGLYLGKTATAADSTKLNGQSASYYSRKLSASYTSVTGDDGTDGWYTLFSVNDGLNAPVQCNIRCYAHTSASFIVSKGYNTNNAMITILNANTISVNNAYKYLKGLRILTDGTVQAKLNSGASVQIDMQLFTSGPDAIPAATLIKDTNPSPSVSQIIDPLANGSVVAYGDFYAAGNNKVWHAGNLSTSNFVGTASDQTTGTNFKVKGTLWVGDTPSTSGDVIVKEATGKDAIHIDGNSSGKQSAADTKVYIAGNGNADFAGTVNINALTTSSTTMVTNLNAEMLGGRKEIEYVKNVSIADNMGIGVFSGMTVTQTAGGPTKTVTLKAGVVFTSSGRRIVFTDQAVSIPDSSPDGITISVLYVRGASAGNNEGALAVATGAPSPSNPIEPSIPVDAIKIAIVRTRQGTGITIHDGTTTGYDDIDDARQWRPSIFDGTEFTYRAILNATTIKENGTLLTSKYAQLGTTNSFTGNQNVSGRISVTSTGSLGGNATSGNHYIKVTDGTNTLSIDTNEVISTDDLYLKGNNVNLQGTTTTVEGKLKAVNNAKTLTIPAGQTSVTWTHNYGSTSYAVNPVSNSFERHVRWTSKAANTISIEIDTPTTQDILVDCILIGY